MNYCPHRIPLVYGAYCICRGLGSIPGGELIQESLHSIFEFHRRPCSLDEGLFVLEMRFEIVECLNVEEMLGRFSKVVAPLTPIGCNFDGSVDEFVFIDDFIDGSCFG